MLRKVLSGAQSGVDQSALCAAKDSGIDTGGFVPKGARTLEGDCPHLIAMFGLTETASRSYTKRTEANVKAADATLIIARNVKSPGTWLTLRCAQDAQVPTFLISGAPPGPLQRQNLVKEVVAWIDRGVAVLNVAGNSEKSAPGIGEWAYDFLREVFTACRGSEDA